MQFNRVGETVLADGIDRDRNAHASADAEARWHQTQREVRSRLADAETIGVGRAALPLRVAKTDEISAVRRQRRSKVEESAWSVSRPAPSSS